MAIARDAFTTHQPPIGSESDGELATAVFDSLLDGTAGPDNHWLRFEHATLAVDVHVCHKANATDISGEISPTGAVRAALHIEGASLALLAEVIDGRFSFNPVGHGLVRLSIEEANAAPTVWTEWFRI
jgi:hypothetical protein